MHRRYYINQSTYLSVKGLIAPLGRPRSNSGLSPFRAHRNIYSEQWYYSNFRDHRFLWNLEEADEDDNIISPYAKDGYIDHQTLSHDACLKLIEKVFLDGQRLDPNNDGRPDPKPGVRENNPALGDLKDDFDFSQEPREPMILEAR